MVGSNSPAWRSQPQGSRERPNSHPVLPADSAYQAWSEGSWHLLSKGHALCPGLKLTCRHQKAVVWSSSEIQCLRSYLKCPMLVNTKAQPITVVLPLIKQQVKPNKWEIIPLLNHKYLTHTHTQNQGLHEINFF